MLPGNNGTGRGQSDPAPYRAGLRLEPAAGWMGQAALDDRRQAAFRLAEPDDDGASRPDRAGSVGGEAGSTIDGLVEALVSAWNRHDAAAFAAAFAEDVEFTNVFGLTLYGRAAIEASHAAIFRTLFKDSALTATDTSVRFIRADVAAVDVRWEMTATGRDPEGPAWSTRHGLMSMLATELAGAWRVTVCHNQDLPPPERVAEIAALLKGHGRGG